MRWIPALLAIGAVASGCAGSRPENLGVRGGRLAPCVEAGGCVSTYEDAPERRMEPVRFEGSDREAIVRLLTVLRSNPRAKVVETVALEGSGISYVGTEFTRSILGLVDDVEFVVDGESKTIHFRSAPRLGFLDFGANRSRMEEISKELSRKP